jgi:hypothetical protein
MVTGPVGPTCSATYLVYPGKYRNKKMCRTGCLIVRVVFELFNVKHRGADFRHSTARAFGSVRRATEMHLVSKKEESKSEAKN